MKSYLVDHPTTSDTQHNNQTAGNTVFIKSTMRKILYSTFSIINKKL